MTEEITAEQALKSKQKFMEYFENNTPEVITATLAKYQSKSGKIVVTICDLTQNIETLLNALSNQTVFNLPKMPYIVWIVTSPKEPIMNLLKFINDNSNNNGLGIFVFKAFLNGDKMGFECLLKPEYKEKTKRVINTDTPVKQLQKEYWEVYFNECDNEQSQMQVDPQPRHYQNVPIGKAGVQILQTINTQKNYVASEIAINNNKEIFNKLFEHKDEIEQEVGELEWDSKENNKSSKIRKIFPIDINDKANHLEASKEHIKMAEELNAIAHKYL